MAGRTEAQARPPRTYRTRPRDVAVEVAGWLLTLGAAVDLALRMPSLPDRIPVHFDATGTPDRWGSPAEAWIGIAVMALVQVMLTVVARIPHRHNYPVRVTEENAQRMYRVSEQMMGHMVLAVGVLTVGIVRSMTADGGLAAPFVVVGLGGTLVATVVGVARVLKASEERPATEEP